MGNLDREIDLMLERSQRRYECLDQQIDLMLEGSLEEASNRKEKRQRAKTYNKKITIIQRQLKAGKMDNTPDGIRIKAAALEKLGIYGDKIKRTFPEDRRNLKKRIKELTSEIEALNNDPPQLPAVRQTTEPQLPAVRQTTEPQLPAVRQTTALVATDPEKEEEKPEALNQEQKEEVVGYLYDAAGILTMRAMKTKEAVNFIDKFGQILRKYFLSRRVLRTVKEKKETMLEEELTMIENSEGEGSQKAPNIPPVTGKQESSILMDLTDYVAVEPKVAKASLATLKKKYKDLITKHEKEVENNDDYKIRFRGLRYLILRAAGLAAKGISTPKELKEGKLTKIVIDLEMLKRKQLNEGLLGMFGAWIEFFLKGLFGGWTPPISVTGNKRDVEAFARAVHGEKSYIEAVRRYGLDHPTTYKNKAKLDNSIKGFEKDTGIKWPFK